MKRRFALLLVSLGLTACGPAISLDTGLDQAGANVLFGAPQVTPSPAPPPLAVNPVPEFPAPIEAPPAFPNPSFAPVAAPTPACPTAPAGTHPRDPAPLYTSTPPAAAGPYPFRHTGFLTSNPGAANQQVTRLPGDGTRQVTNVTSPASDGHYQFDVVDVYNTMTTTTTYLVYPTGPAPTVVAGVYPGAGVYIAQIVTSDARGERSAFQPASPVQIFPFPAGQNDSFQGAGTDPNTHQTMDTSGNVTSRHSVDACGTLLDSWEAVMTGHIVNAQGGPNGTKFFTLTIDLATQYGSLILGDHLQETYGDQTTGAPMQLDVTATIDVAPNQKASQ